MYSLPEAVKEGGGLVRSTYPFPNLAFGELGIALGVNRVGGKGHVHKYSVMQLDRSSLKTDNLHKPTPYNL